MIDQLENIARQKVNTLRFVDEIEVYLAYPIKLKERLDLRIDVDNMLYFRCSGLTKEDLEIAAHNIEEMLSSKDAIPNIIVQRDDWIDALKIKYQSTVRSIQDRRDYKLESAISDAHMLSIQQEYVDSLIGLTAAVLNRKRSRSDFEG